MFGVEDSILKRHGAQAFDKSGDDLVVKYSHDMLPAPGVWCTAKSRKTCRELRSLQKEFDAKQDALLKAGVTKTDADILAKDTQLQKFVQTCRKSHNGPLGDPAEVDELVMKIKDEKKLQSALCAEIRYRKYSSLSIKFDNPLFAQRNLSSKKLADNLKLLLMKTEVTLAAKATMADLEAVLCCQPEEVPEVPEVAEPESTQEHQDWKLVKGKHVAVNFTDGFLIGEVTEVLGKEKVKVSVMQPKPVITSDPTEHEKRFWIWPTSKKTHDVDISCILNLRPCLTLAKPPSTKRMFVFACENAEILAAMADSVTVEI